MKSPGFRAIRSGAGAHRQRRVKQFQLDVYGEVMDTLHLARAAGLETEPRLGMCRSLLLEFLESQWKQPG